jgi:hypothetical protein
LRDVPIARGKSPSGSATRRGLDIRFLVNALAIAGGVVCAGQVILWSTMGAWPFHDTAAYWLGGLHLREGASVYGPVSSDPMYLAFVYTPPWAVIWAPLSLLPLEIVTGLLFLIQVLALRYICGSWRNAGLVAWLPIVPREFVTGNVDLLMAAAMFASIRNVPRSGYATALFAAAKLSPAATLILASRRQWREAIIGGAMLVAITLPVLPLWPDWIGTVLSANRDATQLLPLVVRVPVGLVLLAYRRPWSVAAGAALLTPAFYFHSLVLLIPAARLAAEGRGANTQLDAPETASTTLWPAATSPEG